MDVQIIDKFKEMSGIGKVALGLSPKEALLGISEISNREYEALRIKLWGDSINMPEHSRWQFWDDDFVYIRTRPIYHRNRSGGLSRGSEYFIKIPSELVTKAVVLGEMPPNPMDSCVSDRLKETMELKGKLLVRIGKTQVILDERPERPDDLKEEILSILQEGKDNLAKVEKTLESLLAKAV